MLLVWSHGAGKHLEVCGLPNVSVAFSSKDLKTLQFTRFRPKSTAGLEADEARAKIADLKRRREAGELSAEEMVELSKLEAGR